MDNFLDPREQKLLESIEGGKWPSSLEDTLPYQQAARKTLKKNKRINIRIAEKDLMQLQLIASRHGMPYQTMIGSVLHKYATGQLVEREQPV